jgi:hypothetical protein
VVRRFKVVFIRGSSRAGNSLADVGGGLVPMKDFGLACEGGRSGGGKFRVLNTGKDAAAKASRGEIAEEALDYVEPRITSCSEANLQSRTAVDPATHLSDVCSRRSRQHDVDLFGRRHASLDQQRKAEALDISMSSHARCQHGADSECQSLPS